jgi:hypothetical protein
MVFNDVAGGDGLIQECERITNLGAGGITGSVPKLVDFTARINQGLDRFYALVFKYDQLWNFDDKNQSDLPIASTNLVSGQQDYQFANELLAVTQLFVKDSNGVFHELTEQDDRNYPRTYDLNSSSGLPKTYELVGNSVLLDPIPNYNSTLGLKVTFKRNCVKFLSNQGGIAVGIPSPFHVFLARYASYPYCVEKSLKHAAAVKQLIAEDEAAIREFISNRAKPKRSGLRVRQEDNR